MIYDTWKRTVKAKLSQEELAMAEDAAQKRKEGLTWGPLFQEERTYFPYKSAAQQPLEVPQEIQTFLDSIGFEVVDYRQGLAKKKDKNQPIGMGKILNRENRPDLKKLFDDRLQGQAKQYNENLLVVFSHKPEDIAGSSTDRNWKSCVDLRGGKYHKQMFNKIIKGGLVAYLIRESDKNIENPLARVAIRRYGDNKGNFIFIGSYLCYGIQDNNFVEFVDGKLFESNKQTAHETFNFKDIEKGYTDIFPPKVSVLDYAKQYGKYFSPSEISNIFENEKNKIIKSNDAKEIYKFAKYIKNINKNIDISKLQEAIIKLGNVMWAYNFALNIEGADISRLQELVIKSNNIYWLYRFAKDVEGADEKKLIKICIDKLDNIDDLSSSEIMDGSDVWYELAKTYTNLWEKIVDSDNVYVPIKFIENFSTSVMRETLKRKDRGSEKIALLKAVKKLFKWDALPEVYAAFLNYIWSDNQLASYFYTSDVRAATMKAIKKSFNEGLKDLSPTKKVVSSLIYDTWKRTVKAKLSQEELAMAEEAAQKRKEGLTWGPLFEQERTYFPYKTATQQPLEVPQEIQTFLDSIGFEVVDYRQGLAKKKDKNQPIGIGKILNRENRQDIKKIFDDRLQGQVKQYDEPLMVVFSHSAEDIAGMSTDRNWISCMDLQGDITSDKLVLTDKNKQLFNKIEKGGLVAYLIKEDDKNIENPLARVAIRRYGDNNGNFIFVGSNVCYGVQDKEFVGFVNSKLSESNLKTSIKFENFEDEELGYADIFPHKMSLIEYMEHFLRMNSGNLSAKQNIKLQEQVIKTERSDWITWYAQHVNGADIPKLEDAVIAIKNAEGIFNFARNVEGANIKKLQNAILATNDLTYINFFASFVVGADKELLMKKYNKLKNKKQASLIYSNWTRKADTFTRAELILYGLKQQFADAAQKIYNEWSQEDGVDELLGTGGICDEISEAIANICSDKGFAVVSGGQEGDDHAWTIVHNGHEAFSVDIPCRVYETGAGYSWQKRPDVKISPNDVVIVQEELRDIVSDEEMAEAKADWDASYGQKREGQEKRIKQFATSKNNPDLAIIIGDGYATEESAQILAVNPDGTYHVRTTWSGRDMEAVDPIFFGEYPVTSFWKEKLQNENIRRKKYHKGPIVLRDNEYQKRAGSLIHSTWQRQKFAKKLLAGLVDRLQDSIQGEQIKSKEIADLVRQEFKLPANVVVPIKAIKQDPNFIISNYAKIMNLSQKDSKKTWEVLVPNKKLDIEEDKSQLNADDKRFLDLIVNIVNTYHWSIELDFIDWVKEKGYISNNIQTLNEVYDWVTNNNIDDIKLYAPADAINASLEWHRNLPHQDGDKITYEEYRVGHLGDQTVTVDGQSMKMVNIHSNVDLVEEGNKMGHCVGGENYWRDVESGEKEIYSLRDSANEPHVTIDVQGNEVWQVYGKSDSRPNSKYMPFVRKWIEDNNLEVMGTKLNTYSWLEIVSDNGLWDVEYFIDNFGKLENGKRKKVEQYTKDEREALPIAEERIFDDGGSNIIVKMILNINGIDIKKAEDEFIKSGPMAYEIMWFAKWVDWADINKLAKSILAKASSESEGRINSNSNYIGNDIVSFASDAIISRKLTNKDVKILEDAVIKYGDATNIYDFANSVYGADVNKLKEAYHNLLLRGMDEIAANVFMEKFPKKSRGASLIYSTWQKQAKLSEEELKAAKDAEETRANIISWGPMFQKERTYFPYKTATQQPLEVPQEIQTFLDSIGFEVVDYRQGLAKKKDKNQSIGIGKILNRENRPDLKKIFDDRLQGQAKQYDEPLMVVFSHSAEDIAGMSTDRNWTSCLDLRGSSGNAGQVFDKILAGGLVAYLIKESDKNIETPLARVAIRKYGNNTDYDVFIFVAGSVCYGIQDDGFIDFVNEKLLESNLYTSNFRNKLEDVEGGYLDEFTNQTNIGEWLGHLTNEKFHEVLNKILLNDEMLANFLESLNNDLAHYIEYLTPNDISLLNKTILKSSNIDTIYEWMIFLRDKNLLTAKTSKLFTKKLLGLDGGVNRLFNFIWYVSANEKLFSDELSFFEDIIIKSKNPHLIYDFALRIKGANIKKLQDAIIKTKHEYWIRMFANINGADKELLEKIYDKLWATSTNVVEPTIVNASIYTTWQKKSKLSEEELKRAEEYAKKRPKTLTWGPLFQQERTYFPYTPKADKIQVPWNLESHLLRNGYQIIDYRQGLAQNARTGREIGIGKLLKDQPELLAIFVNRLQGGIKSKQPHFVVFTHKPEDIAGMSTDRGWTSCLTLRHEELKNYGARDFMHGDENQYVFSKITKGGMVAYLVREDDKDIEHPLGRIDLRRYENAYGDFIFVWGEITYGIHDKGFEDFVRNKIRESNSITDKSEYEEFSDAEELESNPSRRQWNFPVSMQPEEAKKYYEPTQTWETDKEVSASLIYKTWKK